MLWSARGATDVGRVRTENEDAYLVDSELQLAVVADGLGGHACGEVASRLAVVAYRDALAQRRDVLEDFATAAPRGDAGSVRTALAESMSHACRTVWEEARRDPRKHGMGTTCTTLVVAGDTAFVSHVGDSRAYLVRDGRAQLLTRDHSFINSLIDQGGIDPRELEDPMLAGYRNALARVVGLQEDVEADTQVVEIQPHDVFVLVSDGVSRYLRTEELATLVADPEVRVERELIEIANHRGGADNCTAVAVSLEHEPAPPQGPILPQLSPAQLMQVIGLGRMLNVRPGALVVRQGMPADAFFAVLTGAVRVERDGVEIARLGPGTAFGEMSPFGPTPQSVTVVACERTRLLRVGRASLRDLARIAPDTGALLLAALSGGA